MRKILIGALLFVATANAGAKDRVYEGTWNTINRPLDGTMTCVVKEQGNNRWRGTFSGVWYGQEFSYTVEFSGPPERLRGTAVIDGANYEWAGEMTDDSLNGRFGGNR